MDGFAVAKVSRYSPMIFTSARFFDGRRIRHRKSAPTARNPVF
jgi:hypothetical protein